jgi:hypothetical protein
MAVSEIHTQEQSAPAARLKDCGSSLYRTAEGGRPYMFTVIATGLLV